LALDLTVEENLMMRAFRERPYAQRGVLALGEMRRHSQRMVVDYDVRTPGTAVRMRQLSGGNQQKVVLAREFDRQPTLLIASQPTRGLDVGATEFVYRRLLEHRAAGGATLLISSELDEILCLADRIAVMVQGRFLRVLDSADVTTERLGLLMGGQDVSA
jgi:general nucleoside transport system ATP-binding protein